MHTRDLSDHPRYEAGGGIEEVARELGRDPEEFLALASNENPLGPSLAAVEAIRDGAEGVHAYPKAIHTDLTRAIADGWQVDNEQVWLANGGDGALDYLARATIDPGDTVLVPDPGFAYYGMSARFHHGEVATYELSKDEDFAQTPETVLSSYDGERIVHVTTPHNPTGSEMSLEDIETLAEATDEETLIVVDEAYGEFTDEPSARNLLDERDDVAVVRTFSKAYGLAGLRLGYALVPEEWADAYGTVTTPFSVGALACRAGLAALGDQDHVDRAVEAARQGREYIHENVRAPTYESGGNFVLIEVGDGTAVAEALKRRGILVRDTTSFGLPSCIRMTVGSESETQLAVRELNEVLAK
ncbi:MAG TPA: histidinol-phosphate transaminase [Natrialbaceae archaeon]|nr:histidinol-phosphate transaminase [Natrialbaceae archaeon]